MNFIDQKSKITIYANILVLVVVLVLVTVTVARVFNSY